MMLLPHYLFDWDWTTTFYRAIVLLVVASPCALVASIMPATLAAVSNGAKWCSFQRWRPSRTSWFTQTIAFDKTGTLTMENLLLQTFYVREDVDKDETYRFSQVSSLNRITHSL